MPDMVSEKLDRPLLKSKPSTPVHCDKGLQSNIQPDFFVPWEPSFYETLMACTLLGKEGVETAEGLP